MTRNKNSSDKNLDGILDVLEAAGISKMDLINALMEEKQTTAKKPIKKTVKKKTTKRPTKKPTKKRTPRKTTPKTAKKEPEKQTIFRSKTENQHMPQTSSQGETLARKEPLQIGPRVNRFFEGDLADVSRRHKRDSKIDKALSGNIEREPRRDPVQKEEATCRRCNRKGYIYPSESDQATKGYSNKQGLTYTCNQCAKG